MIKNKKGESLIGILMGMFILGLVLLGIMNVIIASRDLNNTMINDSGLLFIKNNSMIILNNSDLNNLNIGEEFYIEKNKSTNIISILTGATNSGSMYIDRHGYKVDDISKFKGYLYIQTGAIIDIDNSLGIKNIIFDLTLKKY